MKTKSSILITLLSIMIITPAYAQFQPPVIKTINIGYHLKTGKNIEAKEYDFGNPVYNLFTDTNASMFIAHCQLLSKNKKKVKNEGIMQAYDCSTSEKLWQKTFEWTEQNFKDFYQGYLELYKNRTRCINYYDGTEIWDYPFKLLTYNPEDNFILGYRYDFTIPKTNFLLSCYSITPPKKIFEKPLMCQYGINDYNIIGDSVIITAIDGLYGFNIKTNTQWRIAGTTGAKDYSGTVAYNAAGLAVGLLIGSFFYSTSYVTIHDMASNILYSDSTIYYADSKTLTHCNTNGKIIWSAKLPESTTKSVLWEKDSVLCLLNLGMAYANGRSAAYGLPYMAAFCKKTGQKIYLTNLEFSKNSILDYKIAKDTLYYMFKNRIFSFDLNTGKILKNKVFNPDNYSELNFFVNNRKLAIQNSDSTFALLHTLDSTLVFIKTKNNKIIGLTPSYEPQLTYSDLDIFYHFYFDENYSIMSKGQKSFLIDNNFKKVLELDISYNFTVNKNKIFYFIDNKAIIIDLNEFIKQI